MVKDGHRERTAAHSEQPLPSKAHPELTFERYESGKKRRYELMFAVNGAAYALAIWAAKSAAGVIDLRIGGLSATHIGWGMAGFNLLMCLDIYAFGRGFSPYFFHLPGRLVIIGLSALTMIGWLLAGKKADGATVTAGVPWAEAAFVLGSIAFAVCVVELPRWYAKHSSGNWGR